MFKQRAIAALCSICIRRQASASRGGSALAALNALSVGYPPPLFSPKKAAAFGVEVRQGPAFRARGGRRLAQHRAEWSCPMCEVVFAGFIAGIRKA